MYVAYRTTLEFESPVTGGIPASYLKLRGKIAKNLKDANVIPLLVAQNVDVEGTIKTLTDLNWIEVEPAVEDYEKLAEKVGINKKEFVENLTVFRRDDQGIFIRSYNVKAMIKEAFTKIEGNKWRDVINHCTTVKPAKIRFTRDPEGKEIIRVPNGIGAKMIHIVGARGPRSAKLYYEYIEPPCYLTFDIYIVKNSRNKPVVDPDMVKNILDKAGIFEGLGASRPEGFGRFKVIKFEEIEDDEG